MSKFGDLFSEQRFDADDIDLERAEIVERAIAIMDDDIPLIEGFDAGNLVIGDLPANRLADGVDAEHFGGQKAEHTVLLAALVVGAHHDDGDALFLGLAGALEPVGHGVVRRSQHRGDGAHGGAAQIEGC